MPTDQRQCPDCSGTLGAIKLIDKQGEHGHASVEYAAADASRSFWLGRFPVEGEVRAYLCGDCGRILLYGSHLGSPPGEVPRLVTCLRCEAPLHEDQDRCPNCGWSWNDDPHED